MTLSSRLKDKSCLIGLVINLYKLSLFFAFDSDVRTLIIKMKGWGFFRFFLMFGIDINFLLPFKMV